MNSPQRALTYLPIGMECRVQRKNGEEISARIISGPIPHLLPIGEFYLLGKIPAGPEPFYRGSGRKSQERINWESQRAEIGMYEREQLTSIQ